MEKGRYRIEGVLTTESPLHIGTGVTEGGRMAEAKTRVSLVAAANSGRAYIPATAIRGPLHNGALKFFDNKLTSGLFGTGEKGKEMGGKLRISDAFFMEDTTLPVQFKEGNNGSPTTPLNWNENKWTYVMTGTAIDRVTRTVQEHKLFNLEVVPKNTRFKVVIDGEDLSATELRHLLGLLEQFQPGGFTIGGLKSTGFGRVSWSLKTVRALRTIDAIKEWLSDSGAPVGFDGFPELSKDEVRTLALDGKKLVKNTRQDLLRIEAELQFEGGFLVCDPSRVDQRERETHPDKGPDHVYMEDGDGNPLLPGRAFKGAFRAQAERISRTVQGNNGACYPGVRGKCCSDVEVYDPQKTDKKNNAVNLCPACRLFGAPGWGAPLRISDCVLAPDGQANPVTQQFVAIDRFTGGASKGKLFEARYVYQPKLTVTIEVDARRIESPHLGLLLYTLRDLIEGDICFGYGRSKGFAACTAAIKKVSLPETPPGWLSQFLKEANVKAGDIIEDLSLQSITDDMKLALSSVVEALHA